MATPIVYITSNQSATPAIINLGTPFVTYYTGDTLTIGLSDSSGVLNTWLLSLVSCDSQHTLSNWTLQQASSPTSTATLVCPPTVSSVIVESVLNNDPTQKYRFKVSTQLSNKRQLLSFNEMYESSAITGWTDAINQVINPYKSRPTDVITQTNLVNSWNFSTFTGTSTITVTDEKVNADMVFASVTYPTVFLSQSIQPYGTATYMGNDTYHSYSPVFIAAQTTFANAYATYALTIKHEIKPISAEALYFGQYVSGSSGEYYISLVGNASLNLGRYSIKYNNSSHATTYIHTQCPISTSIQSIVIMINNNQVYFYVNGKAWLIVGSFIPLTITTGKVFVTANCTEAIGFNIFDLKYYNGVISLNAMNILAETNLQ